MLRASLALALVLAACNEPAAPRTDAKPTAPAVAPAAAAPPQPAPPASRAQDPLCNPAASLARVLHHPGAPIAYADTPLQAWVRASDAELGRKDDPAIVAALQEGPPASPVAAAAIEAALAQWMRNKLKLAAEGKEGRAAAWYAAQCAWEVALRPLAEAVPEGARDPADAGVAEEIDRAFMAGAEAFEGDPAALDRVVLPARQAIEKSWYRVAHRLLLHLAGEARRAGDAALARRALGVFDMLRDRMPEKNTPGISVITAMLAGDPAKIDAEVLERELAVALVKRARKYCSEAVDPALGKPLGTPTALATVAEGLTYTRLLLPDMAEKLRGEGFDPAAHLQSWQAYQEAVAEADADEAKKLSEDLVQWNCAYQRALKIRECTSSVDERAAGAR